MLTREQIEEIQTENRERGVSIKKLLKEKGVSPSSKGKSKSDVAGENWMCIEIRTAGGADMRKNFNMLSGIVNSHDVII